MRLIVWLCRLSVSVSSCELIHSTDLIRNDHADHNSMSCATWCILFIAGVVELDPATLACRKIFFLSEIIFFQRYWIWGWKSPIWRDLGAELNLWIPIFSVLEICSCLSENWNLLSQPFNRRRRCYSWVLLTVRFLCHLQGTWRASADLNYVLFDYSRRKVSQLVIGWVQVDLARLTSFVFDVCGVMLTSP